MKTTIFYHRDTDGWASAWCMFHYVVDVLQDDEPDLISVQYNEHFSDEMLEVCDGRRVIIVDFSFDGGMMETLAAYSKELIWIDHHKTAEGFVEFFAQERWKKKVQTRFDLGKAGCVLCWEFLCETSEDESVRDYPHASMVMQYIQDRDIWVWRHEPMSRWFTNAIISMDNDIEIWDELCGPKDTLMEDVLMKGEGIDEYKEVLTSMALRYAEFKEGVWYVNSPLLASEIGNELIEREGHNMSKSFVCVWAYKPDAVDKEGNPAPYVHQLRCGKTFDVGAVAKKFGGGGHPQAAGFSHQKPLWELL